MKNRIRFISHQGKKILLVDCTDCTVEQLIELAALVPAEVTSQPHGSVLLLADFTGAEVRHEQRGSPEAFAGLRSSASEAFRVGGGRTTPQDFLRTPESFSQRDLPIFKTREEALDWLVAD